mmetsp:Transcript_136384/g.304044  ORF Transcript_136384/g.304044 Transcript_136384/m.304044 type:complete len:202 (-) Transcript_136384:981-1586(-)
MGRQLQYTRGRAQKACPAALLVASPVRQDVVRIDLLIVEDNELAKGSFALLAIPQDGVEAPSQARVLAIPWVGFLRVQVIGPAEGGPAYHQGAQARLVSHRVLVTLRAVLCHVNATAIKRSSIAAREVYPEVGRGDLVRGDVACAMEEEHLVDSWIQPHISRKQFLQASLRGVDLMADDVVAFVPRNLLPDRLLPRHVIDP